jgi:transposase-like protein
MAETRQHRRYPKREKAAAVAAALASSTLAAAEAQGIPESTLRGWMHDPAFAELREKTRATIAEEAKVAAQLFLAEIIKKREMFEPRDLVIAFGVLTDKSQLLAGEPTERTETRDLSAALPDHEKDALADAIDTFLKERADAAV